MTPGVTCVVRMVTESQNDAERELLAFLETNVAFVCNTWFEKKNIHKQTWQHPKSKRWHCIDFAIMQQSDRQRCLDATVMRGAECHTDHQLLCMRVRVTGKGYHHKQAVRPKRFNVAKLTNSEDYVAFQEEIVSKTQAKWPHGGSAEEKWLAMRSALTEAAETVLGTGSRHQPDWFRESKNCSLLSSAGTSFTTNGSLARVQTIYRSFGKPDQKLVGSSVRLRMLGSRLRLRKPRGEDLVGRQFGSVSEQCSLEGEAWYPAQLAVSEMRMATNAPYYRSNTNDGGGTSLKFSTRDPSLKWQSWR